MTVRVKPAISSKPDQILSAVREASAGLRSSRRPLLAATVVFVLLLVAWWNVGNWYENRLLVEQRAEVVADVSAHGSALSSALSRRLARLQGLHAFVKTEGSEPDFAVKFEPFAADLYAGSRGIRNLAVAPDSEVRLVYPLEGNESVIGYRPLADSRQEVVADVQRAIASNEAIISGPVELLQGGLGLIARQAVYQDGSYWGLVNVVMDLEPLLMEAGIEGGSGDLEYALRDQNGRILFGPPALFSSSPIISQITLPEGYWELAAAPREGWSALIRQPLLISWLGSLMSITLLASLVYLTVNRQSQLAAAVEQRTSELSAANLQLEKRVEERTLELTILLNIARSIATTIELEDLLQQVLRKLLLIIDHTGGAILTMENGVFHLWAHQGLFPPDFKQYSRYDAGNIIGRQLIEERQPVLIPDVSVDTPLAQAFREVSGWDENYGEYIRSWMGIPLLASKGVIGILAMHHREPAMYSQQNVDLAMAFANQVAVAIENAQLHEKTQRLAVLQERQRLARDLHDSVSQALYGIGLGARTAQKLLEQPLDAGEVKKVLGEPIDYILTLSEGGLAEMRALIFELRPESLENEGLIAALTKQAAALQARHGVEVSTQLDVEPDVPLSTKEALYRVGQEALNNIIKHAGAKKCSISLYQDNNQYILEILDDGSGFDPNGDFTGHLGLRSMRERVEQLGGTLAVTSSASQGTRIVAAVPGPKS